MLIESQPTVGKCVSDTMRKFEYQESIANTFIVMKL